MFLEFLLCRGSSFGAEILQLFLFLFKTKTSLLLLKDSLDLSLLHATGVSDHGTVADSSCHDVVLADRCPRDSAEVRRRVIVVQNVAFDARFLVLSLLATAAHGALTARTTTRTLSSVLLLVLVVVFESHLLISVGHHCHAHG